MRERRGPRGGTCGQRIYRRLQEIGGFLPKKPIEALQQHTYHKRQLVHRDVRDSRCGAGVAVPKKRKPESSCTMSKQHTTGE